MIAGIIHKGSGLGNQLHRYVAVRCLALDKGLDWGMQFPENFKGDFLELPMGLPVENIAHHFQEERVNHPNGTDIRPYDPKFLDIEDHTLIDGEFQDPKYFMHHIDEIREWMKCTPMGFSDDMCVINFRGGEYVGVPELFLTPDYWQAAIEEMLKVNPDMWFEVHTDDPVTARKFFPKFPILSNMQQNWRSIRYATYLILSNSSFAILPTLLNQNVKKVIAPKYWARRNVSDGYWALEQNKYDGWDYI